MSPPATLPEGRYGARPRATRWALGTAVAVVVTAFLVWVGWAVWWHSTPDVRSELVGYTVVDEHSVDAVLDVTVAEGADEPRCTLRAMSEDHVAVGELSFVPVEGRNEVVIRTERRATSVEKVGCTTPRQNQPR
ncbi:MAG TPA: DUF4307 domain-containing protein [Nocardioides sp.]|uniref:DUF4307 domain-containing protein n=1 Tax=Nocardioides sp. TaxID=35761 RepID=UPI002C913A81|nr:DUF4307 domain-containing protein [Nocardioides sp.]HQR26049.1 DUF4307 domain-containing protein [Nocardioides sp.]